MARTVYGYGSGDTVAAVGTDGDYEPSVATFDVYTTRTGSTKHTDLLNMAGTAITHVVPDTDGVVRFQGLDGYTGYYWLQDVAAPTSKRFLVRPVDEAVLASMVTAKGDLLVASGSGTVVRKAVGTDGQIPVADSTATGGIAWRNQQAPWMWTGDLLGVGGSAPIEVPVASTVTALKLRVDTGPVGSALTVELHKNTGSGWVTQDSLTIADGAVGPVSKTGLSITFAAGDLVRLYNVAVGSTTSARGVSLVATLA